MATGDITQVTSGVTSYIPSANSLAGFVMWFLAILIVAGICGFFIWRTWRKKKFPKKLLLWREINGQSVPVTPIYTCGPFSVSRSGDILYKTNKGKWLPKPKLWVTANECHYFEGKDGEWINFIHTSIDHIRKKMGAFFVHEDMRLGRINVGDILEKQLSKKSWWDKWKDTIVTVLFILITTIALVVLFSKIVDVTKAITAMVVQIGNVATGLTDASESVSELADKVADLSDYVDRTSGSGLIQAPRVINGTT